MSLLFTAVAILALGAATTLYVRQLNRSHARLLASLETELAGRRKVEDALRASEGFYHSLVENVPQVIFRKDLEGRFTFVNQKLCGELGRPLAEIVGRTDFDFFPAPLAEKYRRDDAHVVATGEAFEAVEEYASSHGETLYVHVIKTPLRDPSGATIGVQGIFWDVTERKRAEELLVRQNEQLRELAASEQRAHAELKTAQSRLVESEKLASLGQMVAGVAHEINNPVAFVSNNVAVLQRDLGDMRDLLALYEEARDLVAAGSPDLYARIAALRDQVDIDYVMENIDGLLRRSRDGLGRIQQIVKDLRAFARLDEGEFNDADLNEGVESTVTIIRGYGRRKHVEIETDLAPLPPVYCHAAKINQVVMNLLTNAIDACPEGGLVTVRTAIDGAGVRVEVADTGAGIEPAIRDRIFDPFFTTKPIGQGTGLGLSISYGIVQTHGGSIEVDSEPGRGTRFTIRLPNRADARAAPEPAAAAAAAGAAAAAP